MDRKEMRDRQAMKLGNGVFILDDRSGFVWIKIARSVTVAD